MAYFTIGIIFIIIGIYTLTACDEDNTHLASIGTVIIVIATILIGIYVHKSSTNIALDKIKHNKYEITWKWKMLSCR